MRVRYYSILYYIMLHYTIKDYTILYYTILSKASNPSKVAAPPAAKLLVEALDPLREIRPETNPFR